MKLISNVKKILLLKSNASFQNLIVKVDLKISLNRRDIELRKLKLLVLVFIRRAKFAKKRIISYNIEIANRAR